MTQSRAGWLCAHCGHIEATNTPLPNLPNQAPTPSVTVPTEPYRAKSAPSVGNGGGDGAVKDEDLLAIDQVLAKFSEQVAESAENAEEEPDAKPETKPETKPAPPPAASTAARAKARAKGIAATDMHLSVAGITSGPDSTFTGPTPVAALVPPVVVPKPEPEPEPKPEPEPEPTPEPTPAPAPKPEPEPTKEPEPKLAEEPKPDPEPKPEPKPEPDSEPQLVPASPLGPNPEPLAQPTAAPGVAHDAPVTPSADTAERQPLTPETHPKPLDHKTIIAAVIAGFVLILVGLTAYFALATPGHPFAKLIPESATPTPEPLTSVTPTPTPTPAPTPTASTRDAERKMSFAKYLTAYRATISNGFYAVTPPQISVSQSDPTTSKPYVIAAELPAASVLGTLYYLPGFQCTNEQTATKQSNPGKTSTRYVALATYLEASGKLYCQNINQ